MRPNEAAGHPSGGPTRLAYAIARVVGVAVAALLGVGVLTAPFWRPGLWLLLAAAAVLFAGHLALGIGGYRSVMRRPWPKVEPPEPDDDDDW